MSDELMEVVVGRVRIKVPVIQDKNTTLRVARAVDARLEAIEKRSPSIDSHAFALEAAMSFAAELEQARLDAANEESISREEQDQDNKEMLVALTKIHDGLKAVLETLEETQAD